MGVWFFSKSLNHAYLEFYQATSAIHSECEYLALLVETEADRQQLLDEAGAYLDLSFAERLKSVSLEGSVHSQVESMRISLSHLQFLYIPLLAVISSLLLAAFMPIALLWISYRARLNDLYLVGCTLLVLGTAVAWIVAGIADLLVRWW